MKKLFFILIALFMLPLGASSQENDNKETIKLYNPDDDAAAVLSEAIMTAIKEQKHILVQIGGNWCPWCIKLHKFIGAHAELDSIISADYITLKINYSKENKNLDVMKAFSYPQRFGFPVLVVLNENGTPLHIQDTGFLEKDESYDPKKVKTFLLTWNKAALDPMKYVPK
jgi:thioredoxin-related protein